MAEKKEVNRKIKLKYVNSDGTAQVYDTRIKYISQDNIEILAPIELEDVDSLVDQEVTIDEETIGKSPVSHSTFVQGESEETLKSTGERLIVLKRPNTLRIREFARVDVNFPVTVNIITSETKESEDEEAQNSYEALSVNISASGMLFVLGLGESGNIRQGQDIVLKFKLKINKNREPVEFNNISAKVVRAYKLDIGDLRRKYTVAASFSDLTSEQQDQIMHYVLERQIDLQAKELLEVGASPLYEQLTILKDEVKRLENQLKMAHEQIKLAEEARQRSDNIIVQLTKRVSAMQRIQPRRRHRWWKFWEWF